MSTPFHLFLDWVPNCQFAGPIWAVERGLYARADLDVRLRSPDEAPGATVLSRVLDEPLSAGCLEDNLIVQACLEGRPVRAIAATFQDSPMVLMTARDSDVHCLADLAGRRVAMHRDGEHLLRAVLALHGIDASAVGIEVLDGPVDALVAGTVDAAQGYAITEPSTLRGRGFAIRELPIRHPGLHPYAQVLFAATACIAAHADAVGRFVRATLQGYREALAAPDEAARVVAGVSYEQPDPTENRAILEAVKTLVEGDREGSGIGALDRERWRRNLDAYARFGIVARAGGYDEVVDPRFIER